MRSRRSAGRRPNRSPIARKTEGSRLIGRKVQYAPERESDSADGSDVKPDLSVLRASYELRQEPSPSTSSPTMPSLDSLPPALPDSAGNDMGVPTDTGSPPALPPTSPPSLLPLVNQPKMSALGESPVSPSAAASSTELEQEPYGFCKRWLRGYPTLVEWFPKHLGPPRKSASEDPGREDKFRAGERSGGGGYEAPGAPRRTPPAPGIRRRFPAPNTRVIP